MTEKNWYQKLKSIFATEKNCEKVCNSCGKKFRTDRKAAKICNSCLKKKRIEKSRVYKKTKIKPAFYDGIPLREYVMIIERYNHEHKTDYTYGQFSAAVQSGKISVTELNKIER